MCSATAAGPLPSITHTTVGAPLVGFCGAAKTAPSGPAVAVTRSAAKGSAMGALVVSGPDVDAGGNVVVVLVDDVDATDVVVVLEPAGVDGLELHDARASAPSATSATSATSASGSATRAGCAACGRQGRFPRIEPVWRAALDGTVHPW